MSRPSVWITRTLPAANESAIAWQRAGADTLVNPLLAIVPVRDYETPPAGSHIIFTSKNGVDHFAGRNHPVICVGDATAKHAQAAGFENVVSVDGTSKDITVWVLKNLPKSSRVTHVSGKHVRGSITEDLRSAGYDSQRIIAYQSEITPEWPMPDFNVVALYSPLAAQAFREAVGTQKLNKIATISISPATDQALDGLDIGDRLIAARPTEDAMLALLKRGNGLG